MGNILATSLRAKPHLAAFDDMAEQRLAAIDFSPVLTNLIDAVTPDAFPYLAEQFDVLGYKGWRFVVTDAEKRALIKQSYDLHRFKGTPWSIKEALKLIGITNVQINEGTYVLLYNGDQTYNGAFSYGNANAFTFEVVILTGPPITPQLIIDATALVLEYKNQRSFLTSIVIPVSFVDNTNPTDALQLTVTTSGVPVVYNL